MIPIVRMQILCSETQLLPWLRRLPEAFAAGEGEMIYDKRNQVMRFEIDGRKLIAKRFRSPKGFQRLAYSTCWENKAVKAYRYAQRLISLGIDTPRPIAALTLRNSCGLVRQYFFVSEENTWPDCVCLREDPNFADREALIEALAAYIAGLHTKGFLHGDTNLSNFLYEKQADGSYRFAVIDVNRSQFVSGEPSREACLSNLFRLTHVRPLLSALVGAYARHRGWDEQECINYVDSCIRQFERRKRFLHAITFRG